MTNSEIGTMITELKTSMTGSFPESADFREMAESNRSNLSRVTEVLEQIHMYCIGENVVNGPSENSKSSHDSTEEITE